jgi:HK97 gp10 family phage protein
MPPKKLSSMRSEFPAVKKAAWETVQEAREEWKKEGKKVAEAKAQDAAATRGYALQIGVDVEDLGHQSARFFAVTHSEKWGDDPWFLRFFEYGTVHIQAMPFIRPARRKANKKFIEVMGDQLEGKIRSRTRGFGKGTARW